MTEKYNRHPNTICSVCKKEIYKRPSQIKLNDGKVFCSNTCYGISCRKEVACLVCGIAILAGFNKKTCSRACANKNRTGIQYKINRPKDKVKSQKYLKVRLLKIRGGKCERCEYSKTKILQVHHIDRNRDNNELGNLLLICPNCHYEEHHLKS